MMTTQFRGAAPLLAVLRLALAVGLAAPLVCQDEVEPYFSLSSQRTFGTAEKPEISLTGVSVPAVQIRVYRVNDTTRFFEQLEDAHSFGTRMPRPAGKRTLLERIHDWKRGLRREIRYNLREQFTESPRAHLQSLTPAPAPSKETPQSKATYFAEAPLLNQDQLVLSFVQPITTTDRWNSEVVPIGVKEKGVYLVEAAHHDLRAYTILVVSDIVLITKTARGHMLGFVVDRTTGEPVANAEISTVARKTTAAVFHTDTDGLANIPVNSANEQDLRVVVKRNADFAVGDIGGWNFSSHGRPWTGFIYTDRPVYRPGDTMHFRGILRKQATVDYEIPSNESIAVQINDPDGKSVYQKTLTTGATGIIHDELTLTHGASLGSYSIQAKAGEYEMSGTFEVQEYKKPEYEVRVTSEKPRVLEGESVQATIDARYYFGEPVNGGKVKYSIYRSRYWFPIWFDPDEADEREGDADAYDDAAGEQISESQGELNAEGKLTVSIPTTISDNKIDYRYRIEANVTDQAGREISGTGWVIATYGSFVLNVEPDRYFFEPGTAASFKIQARNYDNQPISTPVHVELATWQWRARKASEVKSSVDVTTGPDGLATAQLKIPSKGGQFRVIAAAPSEQNRTVESETYIWSSSLNGGGAWDWQQKTVQIIPDKKTYHAGDKAQILLIAGKPNTPMLVTLEGRDIRSQQVMRSKGASALFEYTVTPDDEPGFFVSATFIRKGELYQGQKRIVVPPEDHKLSVKIVTDKPQYLPGQTATYSLDVTSATGKPVASADFSLGVVDEAIYAIQKDETPDIVNFFYGREWDSVSTESSLMYYFTGEAGKRRMRLAELRSPSVLAQLKPERLVQPKIRKAFPDTAFWAADLTTDSAGHAQAKVSFPDSLTTWRATARGVAPGETFGSATEKTIVRKNLILRLAVPRFFVQGDEVVISGIVHNYLTTAKKARVSVALDGLTLANGAASQDVEIASRAEAKVDWRVKAQSIRHSKITAQALTDEESDALELELPVNPPGVPIRQAKGGSIANSGSANLALAFPSSAVTGSRSLSIRLSPSVAGTIFSALSYLTSFPYGCVEQTMSSFLPDIVVTKAVNQLGLKEPIDREELTQKIQAGLERLYNFHHEDGGWGWWVSDESHPFMTAYVVAGLSEARNDGIAVRQDAIDTGVTWIEKTLGQSNDLEPDLRTYLAYALALAGHPDKAVLDATYHSRSNLSPYGLALLGLAFELSKDGRASDIAGQLEASAHQSEIEAWWPAERDEMLDFSADVTPEASAYAMKLLSHQHPKSPLLPKAALYLVNHRDEGYWWSSTKQTAMVIYGLIDYVQATNELHPNLTAAVLVNGRNAITHAFNGDSLGEAPEITLDEAQLQATNNQIQITSNGQGRLYYSVSGTYYSDQARQEKQGAISLNVLRDYFQLVPGKDGDAIVYDLKPLDGPVAQGDTIAVRLTVTGSDWRYLMAEDPIPAGTEFIQHDELYRLREKPPWWSYWFTRRELHDDRMAIFQTYFSEGQQQYFYLLKIVNPGSFHVSPARVGPMYQPAVQATTESKTLEVK